MSSPIISKSFPSNIKMEEEQISFINIDNLLGVNINIKIIIINFILSEHKRLEKYPRNRKINYKGALRSIKKSRECNKRFRKTNLKQSKQK